VRHPLGPELAAQPHRPRRHPAPQLALQPLPKARANAMGEKVSPCHGPLRLLPLCLCSPLPAYYTYLHVVGVGPLLGGVEACQLLQLGPRRLHRGPPVGQRLGVRTAPGPGPLLPPPTAQVVRPAALQPVLACTPHPTPPCHGTLEPLGARLRWLLTEGLVGGRGEQEAQESRVVELERLPLAPQQHLPQRHLARHLMTAPAPLEPQPQRPLRRPRGGD
jgi:hypothetical protein